MIEERFATPTRRRRRALVLPLLAAAAVAGAAAAQADRSPQVLGNVPVNAPQQAFPADNPSRNTSSIAASLDGQRLLAAFEDLQGLCGPPGGLACTPETPSGLSSFAFSTDGGATWTDGGGLPPIGGASTAGHPWVDRLGSGEGDGGGDRGDRGDRGDHADSTDSGIYFYVSRLQDATTGFGAGIGIYRGRFGTGTFALDGGAVINSANPSGDEYSRQAVAAAKDGSGRAYVVLVNVDEICGVPLGGFGQIEVWRTQDGGDTWAGPAIAVKDGADSIDPNDPNCGATGRLQVAPAPAIGPHGELYIVFQDGPQFFLDGSNAATDGIGFVRSDDGGQTFTAPVVIANLNALRADPPVGYAKNRMNDQARIAVATGGRHRGRVYVTYYSAVGPVSGPPGAQQVVSAQSFLIWSDDRGATWSAPVALGPAVPATGLKRFWPTVSLRPDGDVDVVYMESQEVATGSTCSVAFNPVAHRTGPINSLVDTFWVQSRDGGASFSAPLRVSTQTSNWCTAPYQFDGHLPADGFLVSNAGDYIGTFSVGDRTFALWPDDRNGPMDSFFGAVAGHVAGSHGGDD